MDSPSITGRTATAVLDAAALARLHELDPGGRAGVVQRVLKTFDQSLGTTRAGLLKAREAADLAELRRLAHTLKSSSASVGALALSAACAQTEMLAREQRATEILPVIERLLDELQLAQDAVRRQIQG